MSSEFVERTAYRAGGPVVLLLLAAIFFWLIHPATASHAADTVCDKTLTPSKDSTGYAPRGSRCEGMYAVSQVSDATLTLVGYVKGNFDYALDSAEIIEVRVPPEVPQSHYPVSIRAEAFSLSTYYRMDALVQRGEVLRWPVGEVLLRERIRAESIGVRGTFVLQGTEPGVSDTIHVPLGVRTGTSGGDNDQRLRLYLRSSQDIDYLYSEWSCLDQPVTSTKSKQIYRGGKPIVILAPKGLRGLCMVRFLGVIKKRDSGGEGNEVALRLLLRLGD